MKTNEKKNAYRDTHTHTQKKTYEVNYAPVDSFSASNITAWYSIAYLITATNFKVKQNLKNPHRSYQLSIKHRSYSKSLSSLSLYRMPSHLMTVCVCVRWFGHSILNIRNANFSKTLAFPKLSPTHTYTVLSLSLSLSMSSWFYQCIYFQYGVFVDLRKSPWTRNTRRLRSVAIYLCH